MTANILDAAMHYAGRGWYVLPLHSVRADGSCTCSNSHCEKSRGKHPRTEHGHDDASRDERRIVAWWRRWPDANVGVRAGAESNVIVIDIDPRNGGDDSLHEMVMRFGPLPVTPRALTGGGGAHYYFAHPGTRHVACARNFGGFAGIDLKADAGFVVAAPSMHASGRRYSWDVGAHPDDIGLAPFPLALLAMAEQASAVACVDYRPTMETQAVALAEHVAVRLRGKLRRRFNRDARGLRDDSPSGVDASLATLAAMAKLSDADVEAVVRASRAQAGLSPKGVSYYKKTIGKALAFASEVPA